MYRNMQCKYNGKLPDGDFCDIAISDIVLSDVEVLYSNTIQKGTAENYCNTRFIVLSDIVLNEVHCS